MELPQSKFSQELDREQQFCFAEFQILFKAEFLTCTQLYLLCTTLGIHGSTLPPESLVGDKPISDTLSTISISL